MVVKIVDGLGQVLITEPLKERVFKTGSRGAGASFKVTDGTKRYQVSLNAVEIGSKPAAKPAKKAA